MSHLRNTLTDFMSDEQKSKTKVPTTLHLDWDAENCNGEPDQMTAFLHYLTPALNRRYNLGK